MAWTSRFHALKICIAVLASVLVADAALACKSKAGWQQMVAETQDDSAAFIRLPDGKAPLNRPFEVEVSICVAEGASIETFKLNAIMPAHQHGMNYQPVISQSDPHGFIADGLVFHMAGLWRITVSGQVAGESHTYFIDLDVR